MAFDLSTARPMGASPSTGFDLATAKPHSLAAEPMTQDEADASSVGGRFFGAFTGPAKVLMKMVGPDSIKQQIADIEAVRQSGKEKRGIQNDVDLAAIAGTIPSGVVAGNLAGKAISAAHPILRGMLGGGLGAAAQPVQGDELSMEKVAQVGTGTALGGLIPGAVEGVKKIGGVIGKAIEPLTEAGRQRILQRFQESLIPEGAKPKILQALQSARELVPGSKPTVGEALSDVPEATGLAAHQKAISAMKGVSPDFAAREAEQAAARKAAVGSIAKTPQALAAQEALRNQTATTNYGRAFQQSVNVDPALQSLMSRPSMQAAMKRAASIAEESGESFAVGSTMPVKNLHYMKMALDDAVRDPATFGIGASEAGKIAGTRKQFLEWLEKKSPDYLTARTQHAALSEPINRMQVGQQLEKALASPLETSERSGVFANAMREAPRTIKKATGQTYKDELADILTTSEMQSAEGVLKDLTRQDAFKRLARKTNVGGGDAIPGRIDTHLPNLLSRTATIANAMMKAIGESGEEKIAKLASEQYRDPQKFIQAFGGNVPARYKPLLDALTQQAAGVAGATAGRNY